MERFRAAHVSASKELKKRKGFRNKVKNLLSATTMKNELLVRGRLASSELNVLPVDLSRRRLDPSRMKNKTMEIKYISDVTSKILQSAEAVTARKDRSYFVSEIPLNIPPADESEPEFVSEVKNNHMNHCYNPLLQNANVKNAIKDISATASLPVPPIDHLDSGKNVGEKTEEESNLKKLKRKRGKRRKSIITGFSSSEHIISDMEEIGDTPTHCETEDVADKNNIHRVYISTERNDHVFASNSAVHVNLPVPDMPVEKSVPSFEVEPYSTGDCGLEPLIIRSESQSTTKAFITGRFESACRSAKEDHNYVAEITQSMKDILCSYGHGDSLGSETSADNGVVARALVDNPTYRENMPQTVVTEKLESLCIEESDDCNVSVLRDIVHMYSKAHYLSSTAGYLNASDTNGPQIDIHCLVNDRFLLILKSGNTVYIRGKLTVTVVGGCAEILGYKLKAGNGQEKYTVFSPRGISLLSITSCASDHIFASNDVLQSLCADNQLPEDLIDSLGELDCVLLLEKAESNVVDYLSMHLPNKLFPSVSSVTRGKKKYSFAEKKLLCEFLSENIEENVKLYCKGDDWDSLSDVILSQNCMNEANCTVICGGKGVGKSTLLRFLINRSLSSHEKILCLDFDLGQAEFTVPGCMSAVIIKKPLLGPNFTHLLEPERMIFLGDVNVSHCPTQYLEGAKSIIDYCKSQTEFQHIPWFVNTMGFCKGLGVELMMNLLHMVSPTDVIQIQSRSNKRNFPKHLEAEFVRNYKSSLKYVSCINSNLSYDLHLIQSAAESKSEGQEAEWGLDSRTMRDIVVISYMSKIAAPPKFSLTEIVPYMCDFKNLTLCVSHETVNPNTVLSVMNGSFVGLCVCNEEDMLQPTDPNLPHILLHAPVCQCLGFGVIRGVDMEERLFYVISSLPEHEIQKVNCLVMGVVQLPSCVLLREALTGIVGHVPYTVIGPGQPTGRLSQKSSCHLLLSSAVGL